MSISELINPEALIQYGGLVLLLAIIFAETGVFFGFFLPGDSLLFAAGLLAESPYLDTPVTMLMVLLITAAVAGTCVGYAFGRWAKSYLEHRTENFFYRKKYIEITEAFYQRHGMMAFVLGRFLPIVRTFVPILAGMTHINFKKFFIFNVLGATVWVVVMVMAGHLLGNAFPNLIEYLEYIVFGMILLTAIPLIISFFRGKRNNVH
ncbi:MAG TPA: VTT domain-containing protein [Chryseolinea sp.]|jgi:membrane-associated protein|nr:VTT domain-containing protein [Chryseolinea sp.]